MNFLSLKPESFGLDISDLSLKIAKLKKKGNYFKLVSWGETMLEQGIIEEGEIKNKEALVKSIREAISKVSGEKIRTKNVVVSLPEKKAFFQVIQLPKMAEEELKTAVLFEAENYIPLPMEKVYLDFQTVVPLFNHLDHLDILLGAAPKETVDPYLFCLKEAGLAPRIFEVESQAISRALIKNDISFSTVFIIDFGKSRSSFIIFSGCCLRFTASIPISSFHLTKAISQSMEIDLDEAEKLKIKYGLQTLGREAKDKKSKEVFEAMIPSLSVLVDQIKKYINYYQTHSPHEHLLPGSKEVGNIIICGRGANLKGLIDFLSAELKMPVALGNPWINILPEPLKEIPEMTFKESLGYTSALGLALRGIKND